MKKVLIANRGEIARRVIRTLKKMNIKSVAVYSDVDKNAPHVDEADEAVHLGASPSSESYLRQDRILKACKDLGVDAVHPGYGFLSENSEFARKLKEIGVILIGPSPEAMEVMGDKLKAKQAVKSYGVPLVPGIDEAITDVKRAKEIAMEIGYPVLIKASAGGGGKGMRLVEGEAESMSEAEMLESLKEAHLVIKDIISLQLELVATLNVVKDEFIVPEPEESLVKAVEKEVGKQVSEIVTIVDKHKRSDAKNALIDSVLSSLEEKYPDDTKDIKSIIEDHFKTGFREQILATGLRSDGRKTDDIRKITVEPDILKRTHGSALFTRGETQALVVTTLGSKRDEQIIDSMNDDYKKSFYLHYNFPPYSVGEVGRIGFTGRREIGHGNLAQRAIKPVLPDYDDFPYTIRIVSEIMESNGSSSMASVCGGSLSLMSAGAPLKAPVAGIAMGLITDGKRHAILSDILGMEDHLGDMDFKLAGTSEGITAIQLDLKIDGLPFELMEQALEQAKVGRIHILDEMNKVMPKPNDISPYAPRIMSIMINPEKIGALIGPGGKNIKKIIEDTTCEVNVDDDGLVTVAGENTIKCTEALDMVKALTFEPEVGMEFEGKVSRVMSFGAFVEFVPGREGMVHISELEWSRVEKVEDVLNIGDNVRIKLIKIDDQGRLDFSRRALIEKPEGYVERPKKPRSDRKPFKKRRF